MDFEKAPDNVTRNKQLRNIGLKYKKRDLIFNLCKNQVALIRVEDWERGTNREVSQVGTPAHIHIHTDKVTKNKTNE